MLFCDLKQKHKRIMRLEDDTNGLQTAVTRAAHAWKGSGGAGFQQIPKEERSKKLEPRLLPFCWSDVFQIYARILSFPHNPAVRLRYELAHKQVMLAFYPKKCMCARLLIR